VTVPKSTLRLGPDLRTCRNWPIGCVAPAVVVRHSALLGGDERALLGGGQREGRFALPAHFSRQPHVEKHPCGAEGAGHSPRPPGLRKAFASRAHLCG
jgi:hypothetical protein